MIELAVVGAGVMGTNHARVARGLRDARVRAVVDPDEARASAVASAIGAEAHSHLDAVIDRVDAVVIAAPSEHHRVLGELAIAAGKHVLIEKPIAPDVDDAYALVRAAEAAGVVLAVGHVERFNPAVLELENVLEGVVHIEAARVSPFSPRVRDDVVLDLMIHDLDLVLWIAGSDPVAVSALGHRVRSREAEDLASALITFSNGVTAAVTASRVGQHKIRRLEITQDTNFVSVDLIRQDVEISRVDHSEFLSAEGTRYRQAGMVEIPFLEHRGEPLFLELEDFVSAIRDRRAPRVTGSDGAHTVDLALRIRAAIEATAGYPRIS